ncbi:MAG: MFS transporter [Chthoniobacter sp.]|uniref:MFS transporter n=1 Tax=Chthoniobacter sp. TaxID=2510640 RepID=UPI0032AD583E
MSAKTEGIAPNASRLLWAGFLAILAAGVGFAIRGGIFANWGKDYGFTGAQLGAIGGAGFSGFCFGIILGGLVVDKIGYGKLVAVAFLAHILSAFVTFAASTPANAYNYLWWGMFIFAYANGTLEAVANPLVATLYPKNRTHYLNILHASWPAGMVLGAAAGWFFGDGMHWGWKAQLALYLVPTAIYAILFFGQSFPKSEAAAKGSSFVEMFKDVGILGSAVACFLLAKFFASLPFIMATGHGDLIGNSIGSLLMLVAVVVSRFSIGSVLLLVLFITHALVGAVELGTDGWIQNITGNLFTPEQGKQLFIWTSAIMFSLRFCAHFIERTLKISPVGLLCICATIACIGLRLTSGITTMTMAFAALAVYAIGKTFFWPTMLAVVGDRFPQTGAVAMSIMGGIGMLSAGLVGGPGLGYLNDRFAGEELKAKDAALFEEYKAPAPSKFLNIESTAAYGLDGKKLGEAKDAKEKTPAQQTVVTADQTGNRHTLMSDSYIPATMAVIYLLLFLYFKTIGGYKPIHMAEDFTGGTTGPMEA